MANMCDNTFSITTTEKPTWFKVDPETPWGISFPDSIEDRFLFLYDRFDEIEMQVTEVDGKPNYFLEFGFETKWCPPVDFYASLLEDETVIYFSAQWYEPGCAVLGYANLEDGINEEESPDHYYSEVLDLDVVKEEPCDTWIEMHGDNYMLLSDYLIKVKEVRDGITSGDLSALQGLDQEVQEITEYFE